MNDVKLSLTVALQGRVPVSGEESPVNSSEEVVEVYNEVSRRMEKIRIRMKKCKPAQQVINMSSDAYAAFISNSKPFEFKDGPIKWKNMKKNDKLIWHLEQIAENLGGTIVSYHVFDD